MLRIDTFFYDFGLKPLNVAALALVRTRYSKLADKVERLEAANCAMCYSPTIIRNTSKIEIVLKDLTI